MTESCIWYSHLYIKSEEGKNDGDDRSHRDLHALFMIAREILNSHFVGIEAVSHTCSVISKFAPWVEGWWTGAEHHICMCGKVAVKPINLYNVYLLIYLLIKIIF